jgi:hypothetical protein
MSTLIGVRWVKNLKVGEPQNQSFSTKNCKSQYIPGFEIRQMTALLLKQCVDTHWSSLGERFKGRQISILRVFQRNFLQ